MKDIRSRIANLLILINPIYAILILATVIIICYGNSLQYEFVWDDHLIIVENRLLSNVASLPALLLSEDTFPGISTGYYRPLTYLSFFADRMIWGTNPLGFSLTNIILHLLVCFVLYMFIKQAFLSRLAALFASLVMASHPVAAEAINFHSGGRNTLLCALFILLSLSAHLRGNRKLTLFFAALSMLSKEFGLLLPLLLMIFDKIVRNKTLEFRSYLPSAAVAAIYLIIRSNIVSSDLYDGLQIITFLTTFPEVVVTYTRNFILPIDLKTIYSIDKTFRASTIAYSAIIVGAAGVIYRNRQQKMLVFGSVLATLLLLPVLNFIPIGVSMMADRHAYLMLIGFSIIAGSLLEKLNNRISWIVVLFLLLFYSAIVINRNNIWKDDFSLYTRMIEDAPKRGIGYQNLGLYHYKNGDSIKALEQLTKSYSLGDNNAESLFSLAAIHYENGHIQTALPILNRLIEFYPETPQAHLLLGRISYAQGDIASASFHMAKVQEIAPGFESKLAGRADRLTQEAEQLLYAGEIGKSEHRIRTALILVPDFVPALMDLGIIHAEKGETEKALAIFLDVMKKAPSNPIPHYNAYEIYKGIGKTVEAEKEMTLFNLLSKQQKIVP